MPFLVERLNRKICIVGMPKNQNSIYLTKKGKEAKFSYYKQHFEQFACNLPSQQSENSICRFKLPFSVKLPEESMG